MVYIPLGLTTSLNEPFRNQIDYIATKIKHKKFVTIPKSYGGIKSIQITNFLKCQYIYSGIFCSNIIIRSKKADLGNFAYKEKTIWGIVMCLMKILSTLKNWFQSRTVESYNWGVLISRQDITGW